MLHMPAGPGIAGDTEAAGPVATPADDTLGSLDEPLIRRTTSFTSTAIGSLDDGLGNSERESHGATVLHSVFNVVNLFMGVGLLSLPYAIHLGGWAAAAALVIVTVLFGYSGQLIVAGFQKVHSEIHSYAALGFAACGETGRKAVLLCTFLDLFGGCAVCLIMACKQLEGLLLLAPSLGVFSASQAARALGIGAAGLTVFIRSFRQLALLSALGICCSVAVLVAVCACSLFDLDRSHTAVPPSQEPPPHHILSSGMLQSIGIFALSMAGHSALPSFRSSMANPGRFHYVITSAFTIMLAVNAVVGLVGYWYWGDAVTEVVMTDIAQKSPLVGIFGISTVMTALIGVNAFSKVPTLLLVLQDMVMSTFLSGKVQLRTAKVEIALKLFLFAFVAVLTATAYNVLGNVMSLLGGLTSMNASVVFPAFFYMRLFWGELRTGRKVLLVCVMIVSIFLSVSIVAQSTLSLMAKFRP